MTLPKFAKGLPHVLFVSFSLSSVSAFAAPAPQKGGTLVYGRGADSVSLDPARETDGESLSIAEQMFDSLVRFKPGTTEIEPSLAKSWTISPDSTVYTFTLRTGIKFHDGTPLNADAVVFSFLRQHDFKHEAFGYAKTWGYWNDLGMTSLVKKISKVDDSTVKIELARPEAPFLTNLAMPFADIVSPTAVRKYKADFAKNPVGSGPFKFVSWTRGERIILEANKDYWDSAPNVDKVIVRSIPDGAARLNAFLAKEIQMMNLPTPDQVEIIKKQRPDAKVSQEPALNIAYLSFNTKRKPFNNVNARLGMAYAIDRDAMVKGVYGNSAVKAVNPIPPNLWGYNKKIVPYAFDPKKGAELLEQANLGKGSKIELYYPSVSRPYMPDGKRIAEAIQSDLKKIGIEVTLSTFEWATYIEKTKNGDHQMALFGWTGDNGDPDNFLHMLLSGENAVSPASNISFYDNPEVTDFLRRAKNMPLQRERSSLYERAQETIFREVPMLPIAHSKVMMPMDKKINGFIASPMGSLYLKGIWIEK